jgi:hypothetical protein
MQAADWSFLPAAMIPCPNPGSPESDAGVLLSGKAFATDSCNRKRETVHPGLRQSGDF